MKPSLGLDILSLIEGGCSAPNGISGQAMKAQNTIHGMYIYTDECSAVVYSTSTRVQRHTILWIIHAQTDAVQRSQYTVHTILQTMY